MVERKQPRRWIFFALDQVPPLEAGPDLYRWAQRPIVYQAFPAFIEGRVAVDGWLDIVRASSSMSGEYNIDHGAVLIQDNDALIRALLDTPATQWFLKRIGIFALQSDMAIRDAVVPARQLFRGACSDVQILDDRKAQLDFEDILAPYLDRIYPQYRMIDAYPWQPTPPTDPEVQAAWAFLGTTGDFVNGDTVTVGSNVYTFQTTLTNVAGHVQLGGSLASSLSNLVAAINAGAGSGTAYAAATVIHPDVTAALSAAGADIGSLGSIKVTANVVGVAGNAIPVTESGANSWWFNEGGVDSPTLMHGFSKPDINVVDPAVQPPTTLMEQVIPIYYGPHVQTKLDPVTGLPTQGICPVFFMGFTFVEAGGALADEPTEQQISLMAPYLNDAAPDGWGELVVCAGELEVTNVYRWNLQTDPSASELVPEDQYGVTVLAPGHPGWPFSTNYVIRNGFQLTVIYVRGQALWQHITGDPKITVDVCGWPDADGVPIDQAGFAYQDFIDQHVLAHDGEGYTGGPRTDLQVFPPTIDTDRSMIWTSKIQDFQALTEDRLGTEKGYLISMGLTEPTTLREILRTWHVTFDAFSAKNSAGQLYPFVIDDIADPESGVPIRERIELLNLPAPRIAWQEIENEIDYTFGWDHVLQLPRTTTITIRDEAAQEALNWDVRKVSGIRNLAYTADDATAKDTMERRLMRLKEPPRYQPLPMRTDAVDREIGEQIRVSHKDGFGAPGIGYMLRPMVLLNSVHRGDHITMEALDVQRITSGGRQWAPDTVPDSAQDATEEELAQNYWIWTADDGTVSVGDPARWR